MAPNNPLSRPSSNASHQPRENPSWPSSNAGHLPETAQTPERAPDDPQRQDDEQQIIEDKDDRKEGIQAMQIMKWNMMRRGRRDMSPRGKYQMI
ncbi:hypothetical protein CVT25_001694 [Psilocybe cyanescens]|uniref:Uncharacterized protein n=1 Tax=Psilocybe cyanescens TaxID=93625 RepID=A0A409X5F3_PSICY|nr:hypothetical protein CVT25_001694 [Psilocybe cyanescens]